ncbi:hypothetical protein Leryth_008051 [Lithospermum erythrorhizon]|nr:hypothetical protein Leryth_008051 [Lithospermum erythrorhizon]
MHKFGIIYQFLNLICNVVDFQFDDLIPSVCYIVKLAYEKLPVDPLEISLGLSDEKAMFALVEKILKNFDSEFYAANGIRFGLPSEEDLDFNLWNDYVTLHHQLQLESNSCFPKMKKEAAAMSFHMVLRSRVKKQLKSIAALPEEILFNILLLLPADVLYAVMRFVCRQCYMIINDPAFLNTHSLRPSSILLVQYREFDARFLLVGERDIKISDIKFQFPGRVMSSCNGLTLVWTEYFIHFIMGY